MRRYPWGLLGALCSLLPSPLGAFEVSTPVHSGCHESLTSQAMDQAASTLPGLPRETNDDDRLLADSLQFDVEPYGTDRLTISMILGSRYNDLHGASVLDFHSVVPLHNDPASQQEHCLRSSDQDGDEGLAEALQDCRDFISTMVDRALGGQDRADPEATEQVEIYLISRGQAPVEVSRLYFNLGRALHTVQDSFSHGFRSDDHSHVVELFNWVDDLEGTLVPERDGYPHQAILDDCTCLEDDYQELVEAAAEASADLLRAVLEPTTAEARDLRLQGFFARWMDLKLGCHLDNEYCDSEIMEEMIEEDPQCPGPEGGCSCELASSASPSPGLAGVLLLFVCALALVARRRGLLALVLLAAPLEAQEMAHGPGFVVFFQGGLAYENPALTVQGGARYQGETVGGGLVVDYNPYVSLERGLQATAGSLNILASGTIHFPMNEDISLRIEGQAGLAILLYRTPGYDIGTPGVFIGLRPLGLEYRLMGNMFLTVDPLYLAAPVFRLDKTPFHYKQWRTSLGLLWRI